MTERKFSRYMDTQFNHYTAALSSIKDSFSCMRIFKLTHEKCMAELNRRVYESNHYKRLSGNWRARLDGYIQAEWDFNYRFLFWGGILNGRVVDMHKIDKEPDFPGWKEYSDMIQLDESITNHYWNEPDRDGKYRPY